jgi:hypothetical protein
MATAKNKEFSIFLDMRRIINFAVKYYTLISWSFHVSRKLNKKNKLGVL